MLSAQLLKLKTAYQEHFNESPSVWVKAPGRINLIGEHTDYSEGFVLPLAINRYVSLAFSPRKDSFLILHSVDFNQKFEVDLLKDFTPSGTWTDYILGTIWAFKEKGFILKGLNGVLSGNIPIGAGLSSSAALQVAFGSAILNSSMINITTDELAKLCQKGEVEWVGVDVGIMDQLISASGISSHSLLIDCRTLKYDYVKIPDGISFVVLDTNTRRKLTQSGYNTRHLEVREAAKLIGVPFLRDATLEMLLEKRLNLSGLLFRRAKHVISENQRVFDLTKAMGSHDLSSMGTIINESHHSLAFDFEVSTLELDTIVNLAQQQPSCFGARMMGAGFGGCGLALINPDEIDTFSSSVYSGYLQKIHIEPQIYNVLSSDGVRYGKF